MVKKSSLRVVSVQVKDVLGARLFSMAPGRITVLKGGNGSGKSSALQAVQAALGGGNLAKLARVGAAGEEVEPEVVLVVEGDGTESYLVEKGADKTVRVRARVGDTQAFETVPRGADFLRSLYDPKGANPVSYLTARDEDRALMLLEALPLVLDRDELAAILGPQAEHVPPLPPGLHPLEELELVRDAVFRARTGVNRDHRGKADAADQTRRKLPATLPDNPAGEIALAEVAADRLAIAIVREDARADAAERELATAAEAGLAAEAKRVEAGFKLEAAGIRADGERRIAAIKAEVEDAITGRLRRDCENILATAADARNRDVTAAREARAAARKATEARRGELGAAREALATLRAQAQESAAARALQEQAETFEREAEELRGTAAAMSSTLEQLDAFRRRLAEELPIPGLEIAGGAIKVNGVPFDQLNTEQRIGIAVKVACLRARSSRLPVLFVDGAEALDTAHFDALVAALSREGVQAFLARVEDRQELAVEVISGPGELAAKSGT